MGTGRLRHVPWLCRPLNRRSARGLRPAGDARDSGPYAADGRATSPMPGRRFSTTTSARHGHEPPARKHHDTYTKEEGTHAHRTAARPPSLFLPIKKTIFR